MKQLAKINLFFLLLFVVIFLSGCQTNNLGEKMQWLDGELGKLIEELDQGREPAGEPNSNQTQETVSQDEPVTTKTAAELTKEEKEKIDQWLERNNLNRYGDAKDTMYAGGTPLFDEATGVAMDRYDYILNNHPDILSKIYE